MTRKTIFAAAIAGLLLGATASPALAAGPDTGARQCFFTRNVNGFAAPDGKTVYVRVGVRDVYQFEMLGACPDVEWSNRIALVSKGTSAICTGMDAEVITERMNTGPQHCPVRSVRKLSPEEAKALPKGSRP